MWDKEKNGRKGRGRGEKGYQTLTPKLLSRMLSGVESLSSIIISSGFHCHAIRKLIRNHSITEAKNFNVTRLRNEQLLQVSAVHRS